MTEHDDVIRLLREGRPQATERELDEIKQRVRRRATRRSQPMKSRLAILGMLVAGMVFSTAGAGLAVSGIASQNASQVQYPSETPQGAVTPAGVPATSTPEGGVAPAGAESPESPERPSGAAGAGNAPVSPAGGVAPATATETQPTRQEAVTTQSQLPFTGFAAIPVLLGGLALLTGGLILRRRTRAE